MSDGRISVHCALAHCQLPLARLCYSIKAQVLVGFACLHHKSLMVERLKPGYRVKAVTASHHSLHDTPQRCTVHTLNAHVLKGFECSAEDVQPYATQAASTIIRQPLNKIHARFRIVPLQLTAFPVSGLHKPEMQRYSVVPATVVRANSRQSQTGRKPLHIDHRYKLETSRSTVSTLCRAGPQIKTSP